MSEQVSIFEYLTKIYFIFLRPRRVSTHMIGTESFPRRMAAAGLPPAFRGAATSPNKEIEAGERSLKFPRLTSEGSPSPHCAKPGDPMDGPRPLVVRVAMPTYKISGRACCSTQMTLEISVRLSRRKLIACRKARNVAMAPVSASAPIADFAGIVFSAVRKSNQWLAVCRPSP
jgi:hypothetical protein